MREGVKLLAIDGVTPSNETIASGEYPYTQYNYAVIRKDEMEDSPARRLFDFLVTAEGKALMAAQGYVPAEEGENCLRKMRTMPPRRRARSNGRAPSGCRGGPAEKRRPDPPGRARALRPAESGVCRYCSAIRTCSRCSAVSGGKGNEQAALRMIPRCRAASFITGMKEEPIP